MKNFILIGILLFSICPIVEAQNVFFENFEGEADGATTGTDQFGTNWTATCTYCGTSGDWNEVNTVSGNNYLEGTDTNGPAEWITGEIDISSCTEGVTISLDLSHVSTLEGIQATCAGGCNTIDLVKLEVSYDSGSSWFAYSDAGNGTTSTANLACDCGTCGSPTTTYPVPWCGAVVSGPTITVDDFTAFTFSDCISVGVSSTVMLKITTMTWAGAESIRVDNVTLACSSCALPVELIDFEVERTDKSAILSWSTMSELDNKKFNIERSLDGVVFEKIGSIKGKGSSDQLTNYSFSDKNPLARPIVYYRIQQMDKNGEYSYSEIKSVRYLAPDIFYNGTQIEVNFLENPTKKYTVNLYDALGKLLFNGPVHTADLIQWTESGFYTVEIPELEIRKKIVIP
jgi:hypothetical protein